MGGREGGREEGREKGREGGKGRGKTGGEQLLLRVTDHPVFAMAIETELIIRLAWAWLCRDSPPSIGHTTTN